MRYEARDIRQRAQHMQWSLTVALVALWWQQLRAQAAPAPAAQHRGDPLHSGRFLHTVYANNAVEAFRQYAQLRTGGRALAAGSSSTDTRVVVVNDIAGHFEVLAGVLCTLHRMRRSQQAAAGRSLRLSRPRVLFTGNARGPTLNGLIDWLGADVANDADWHALGSGPGGAVPADGGQAAGVEGAWRTPAEVVVCVSAELAPKVCAAAVAGVQPQLLVVIVHRADTHTKNSKFLALHPQATRIMALAPHVSNLSRHMLKRDVDWSMPVAPFLPAQPCRSKDCLQGFSIQGALRRYKSKHGNGFTRDYGALWARMLELRKQGVAVPPVVVVGKGERRHLMLPRELESSVTFHPWLKYQDFWMLIHRSFALVPAFGMPVYYESRISSTILASLITCVPVIAEQRLLDTYTFLSEEHVFLRQPDEDEAAAMARIAALPERAIFAKREALCELRQQMDARADQVFGGYLAEASRKAVL